MIESEHWDLVMLKRRVYAGERCGCQDPVYQIPDPSCTKCSGTGKADKTHDIFVKASIYWDNPGSLHDDDETPAMMRAFMEPTVPVEEGCAIVFGGRTYAVKRCYKRPTYTECELEVIQ